MTTRPDTRGFNSRSEFLFTVAGSVALASAAPGLGFASQSAAPSNAPPASAVPFVEHRISHDGHMIYARDYPGRGPAYVLLHGFPDNLHIYDYVVPYLTPGAADAIASIYPHATVKPVQAGHWLMIDAPEQVANLLLAGA